MKQETSAKQKAGIAAALVAILVTMMYGCAVPVAPTGGPTDSTPPEISSISPARDAVNVSTRSITVEFSEYVNQASFQRSIEFTPELDFPAEFNWKKRRVEIVLRDTLRQNTTYILTIDTGFTDLNGVSIPQPQVVAFSTGPTINRATLQGSVISADGDRARSGMEVHAFAMKDSTDFPEDHSKPDYRTQTDPDGAYEFSYLSPGLYYVLAFRDINKNRVPDDGEPAGSSQRGWAIATEDSDVLSPRIVTAVKDTLAPVLTRASWLSTTRASLRFSEGIDLASDFTVAFGDSTAEVTSMRWVYKISDGASEIGVIPDTLAGRLLVRANASDSTGNRDTSSTRIRVTSQVDTATVRFERFFSPIPEDSVAERFPFVTDGTFGFITNGVFPPDSLASDMAFSSQNRPIDLDTKTPDGRRIFVQPKPGEHLPDTIHISIRISQKNGDTTRTATFVRLSRDQLGDLSGSVRNPESASVVVRLKSRSVNIPDTLATARVGGTAGNFVFSNLPEDRYGITAFVDRNSNGMWDGGSIFPFESYEPVTWIADTIRVRARWESILADTISFESSYEDSPEQ